MKKHPDDYYNDGIFEMARFGKNIIMKNNITSKQHKQLTEKLIGKYDEMMYEINDKVVLIKDKILKCDPVQLLSFSADMGLMTFANIFSEFNVPGQNIPIVRATEYIQSIFVSLPFPRNEKNIVKEENGELFFEIMKDIEELYELINVFYICWGFKLEVLIPNIDENMKKFLMEAQLQYLVRGQRYQIFEAEYYKKILSTHNNIFVELFDVTVSDIIEGIKKLQYSLTQGKADVLNKSYNIIDQFETYQSNKEEKFLLEHKSEVEEFYNKIFGTHLREVTKNTGWPEKFVDELSWELNSYTSFFNQQEFSGWPIIDLPIFKRPFIKIENVSYCFDYYSFIDNFYRVLQKTVTRLCPSYKWADQQNIASETMVEEIFRTLLPNCITYSSNHYPINESLKNTAENDLLVLYDDTIIIVEVKAGSFVYTPPINDYKSHIRSYKTLIEKADYQCHRTKEYLTNQNYPPIYDDNLNIKANIDMTKISYIYMMSVTIDNINTFAAKAEKMNFLNLKSNTISVAVDDLMVYREYFKSPLTFLHFLQQRSIATQEPKLALNDELDHLGMYINHNCYALQPDNISKKAHISFIGYREEIDDYFCKLYHPQLNPKKPEPDIPKLIAEIINYLEGNSVECRSQIANYLLNFSSETRNDFCEQVEYVLKRQINTKSVIPIHTAGSEDSLRYTCIINQERVVETNEIKKRDYTLACLLWNNETERVLIDLYFEGDNKFKKIQFKRYNKSDIKSDEIERLQIIGQKIASNRIEQYKRTHKIKVSRNDMCPCGSGNKYKRCCGK